MKLTWRRGLMVAGLLGAVGTVAPSCVVRATARPAVVVVDDQPPDPAPRYRTPAPRAGFVWVRGRYYRSSATARWQWRTGKWQRVRRGKTYTQGRWVKRGRQWHWVEGNWATGRRRTTVRDNRRPRVRDNRTPPPRNDPPPRNVPPPRNDPPPPPPRNDPPPPRVEYPPGAPRSAPPSPRYKRVAKRRGFVWIRGRHLFANGKWSWQNGHWERVKAGKRWQFGRWVDRGGYWVWVKGKWVKK